MSQRFPVRISLLFLSLLGCTAPPVTAEDNQALGDDEPLPGEPTGPSDPGDVVAPDPAPIDVPCPAAGIGRCNNKLTWNGAPAQLVGYSDYEVATRDGFDRVGYLQGVRPSVNLQRIWASGYSNTGRFCSDDCCPFTETLAWTVTGMHNNIPIYDLFSFSSTYTQRLTQVLNEASADHGVVELTLFDHWALSPAQFGMNPWNPANNNLDAHGCHKLDNGAFPAFFQIFEADGQTLNCLGVRQKAYVDRVMGVAHTHNNVVVEIMNEAGGAASNAELVKWHSAVAGWVRASGPRTTAASIFSASLADQPLSAAEKSIFGAGAIDLVSLHYREWKAADDGSGNICKALEKFKGFGKPIVIDDDGGFRARKDVVRMFGWANTTLNVCTPPPMGAKHFNHKGPIGEACREQAALRKLATLVQNP